MYKTEKIAILLATYQGEKYIREQMDSLLNQTYSDWVCYIHDDGSKDSTGAIIHEYCLEYPEHFVEVDGPSQGGAKNNFIYLMNQVDAPYIMCCDQDDVWMPHKIAVTYEEMQKLEGGLRKHIPILVFTELQVVDSNLNVLAEYMRDFQELDYTRLASKDIANQAVVTGCTVMMNHTLLRMCRESFAKLPDTRAVIMHDWWASLIAAEFGSISCIMEPTIKYRQHEENSVGAKAVGSFAYAFKKLANFRSLKESIRLTREQAGAFCKAFDLSEEHVLSKFASVSQLSKKERDCFYEVFDIRKSGKNRNRAFKILR